MTNEEEGGECSLQENTDDEPLTECAACGAPFDPSDWHPVAAVVDQAGEFHLFAFCSVECRQTWNEEKNSK